MQCDASQIISGLGAAILQNDQIEKEMLAMVFALERFSQYTYGRNMHIESDHMPLEAILLKPRA